MKSACVGVLSIIELKNAQWNIEKCIQCSSNAIKCTFFAWLWI